MNIQALHHENFGIYAYPVSKENLSIRLRTAKGDFSRCRVYYVDRYDYGLAMKSKVMDRFATDETYDYYQVYIQDESKRFKYFFQLEEPIGLVWFYSQKGVTKEMPKNVLNSGFFQFPYINHQDLPDVPCWAREAIFYQIFPERFFNGDKGNDPEDILPWGVPPKADSFYGGDIKGITQKLGYLEALGVNALYLTPIYLSPTNHKYDVVDYYRMDPQFGELEDMKELVEEAHGRGMRIVLDAVFNHLSSENPIFQDVVKKGKASPYAEWFHIKDFPVRMEPIPNYETFGINLSGMPRLNTSHPEVQEYLLKVGEYWTRELDIDGWRLDVADEVPHGFWKEFRKRMRAIKKDLLIIGEVWYNATPWLLGDEFDSVMNYPFRQAVLDFIVDRTINRDGFGEQLDRYMAWYKDHTLPVLLNLLGSHDTARFLTLCRDDKKKMKLAVLFAFTFIGIPMIYYGDEVGMEGSDDPDCRRTMIWEEEKMDEELLTLYKKMIAIRQSCKVLTRGKYRKIDLTRDPQVFSFVRERDGEEALIILNNGRHDVLLSLKAREVSSSGKIFVDLLHDQKYRWSGKEEIQLSIPSMDGVVLVHE